MKQRVVVIDDDPGVLRAFQLILSPPKFSLTTFDRSEIILDLIRRNKPEVVILDMKMPNEKERMLLQKMKEIDDKIIVIVMTAYTNIMTRKDAFSMGADDYLQKPFDVSSLLSRFFQVIEKDRLI
jgi:putative two-component system response regulator